MVGAIFFHYCIYADAYPFPPTRIKFNVNYINCPLAFKIQHFEVCILVFLVTISSSPIDIMAKNHIYLVITFLNDNRNQWGNMFQKVKLNISIFFFFFFFFFFYGINQSLCGLFRELTKKKKKSLI